MNVNDFEIKVLLQTYKHIAVIGLSPNPQKPSHSVPLFMKSNGYGLVGVYPGKPANPEFDIYENLKDVPAKNRRFVNVFRRSEQIPELVEEILKLGGVEVLWLQLGISNPEAELKAEKNGIKVISDRCLLIEYKKHFRR